MVKSKCDGKVCPQNKICNPKSGRCVLKSGKIGKELLKHGSPKKKVPKRKSRKRVKIKKYWIF